MSGSPQEGPSLSGAGFPPGGAGAGPGRVHLLRGGVGPRDSTPEGGGWWWCVWRLKPSVGRMSSAILKNCLDLTWKVMVQIRKFGAMNDVK